MRLTQNRPLSGVAQMCVKPRKSNVSGFPAPVRGLFVSSALSCGVSGRCGPRSRLAGPFGPRQGRVPYLRHRWVLTGLLDADEADLWPEVRAAIAARSRPAEIKAVYPNRRVIPCDTWLSLFGSAERETAILAGNGLFLARLPGVLDVLADQARDGLRVRICLRHPDEPVTAEDGAEGAGDVPTVGIREALGCSGS